MRLLLIDSRVQNYQAFIDSTKELVESIVYNFYSDTYESILNKKTQDSYESIALVSHNYHRIDFSFLYNEEPCYFINDNFDSWDKFYNFLANFNTPIVDMLACSLFSETSNGSLWKDVFINLESRGCINFRASADDTGNLSIGGNWIMESDNVNVKDLYFTELIEEYKYLLSGQFSDLLVFQRSNQLNTVDIQYQNPGTVAVWGNPSNGGNTGQVIGLTNVKSIYSTDSAFAALKQDGTVAVWGNPSNGGNTGQVIGLTNVKSIYSSGNYFSGVGAFAALKQDGTVAVWGNTSVGGNTGQVEGLTNVKNIYSNGNAIVSAFAALKEDGTVSVWGALGNGGNTDDVEGLTNVKSIYSNARAFAALKEDGTVAVWGNFFNGGDTGAVEGLANVKNIYSNGEYFGASFTALKNDKTLYAWGSSSYGGNNNQVIDINNVSTVYSTTSAYAALIGASDPINIHDIPGPTGATGSTYNTIIPIKNNSFSNLLNYLLYFPK
jgi:hypothetical protein